MARLVTTRCPRCGADVVLEDGKDSAVCKYCNTVATLDDPRRRGQVAGAPGGGCSPVLLLLLGGVLLSVVGAGVGLVMMTRSTPAPPAEPVLAPSPVATAPLPTPEPVVEAVPAARPVSPLTNMITGAPLLALDVDGDHHVELVAPASREGAQLYVVYDAATGAEKAHTAPIADLDDSLVAGLGNRLIVAQENGQLTAFDLVSGDPQWTTSLGERVDSLCESRTPTTVHVETNDERKLSVDLTTGRQTETREPCATLLAQSERSADVRDRRDYAAPRGVESYRCGGVTVMGDQNFRVADQCQARAHVNSDALDGMVGHRVWRSGHGWLVFGVRHPGAYVPMVGRLDHGSTFAWKAEVPVSNPLEAATGGPRQVALVGDALVVAYDSGHGWVLTCFAVADGTRRWTSPLGDGSVDSLLALEDAVAVAGGGSVRIVSVSDGATRTTL